MCQQRSNNRSISVLSSSSVTSHLQLYECSNIIEPDEDKLVDWRLLNHLAEMSLALSRTYYTAWTREDQARAIMSQELLTVVGYAHIKVKMNRGDKPLSDLHCYGSARIYHTG
mmetsp:Transcript_13151/g.24719  ORF Transcript_13151/g.24719 Transcript_13151/m.24719 type:complete len:113 (+) Transcript_13151:277-615(+)